MVTMKQKPIVDSQKIKKRESKHTTMANHLFIHKEMQQERKKGIGELQNSQNTTPKMALVSSYLIITLNINVLNFPIKRQSGQMDLKDDITICCFQDSHTLKTQMAQSEGVRKSCLLHMETESEQWQQAKEVVS